MSILDTIDGALADYEASGDAMRWVPEEDRLEQNRPAAPVADLAIIIDTEPFNRAMAQLVGDVQRMAEAYGRAAGRVVHEINRVFAPKAHKRCVTCHPWRKPKPLAVNGHEYQRRLKARRRRRR